MQREIINSQFSLADMLVVATVVFIVACLFSYLLMIRQRGDFGE